MRKILIISIVATFLSGCAANYQNGIDWTMTNTADELARQAGQALGGYGTGQFEWSRVQHRAAWEAQHTIGRILQAERRARERGQR